MDDIRDLQIGDTIECAGASDLLETMYDLSDAGYDTDFLYEKDGREGYWLIVTGYDHGNMD